MSAEALLLGIGATFGALVIGAFWLADRWMHRHFPNDEV